MARIEQLKVYGDPLHVQGSPIVIEAYALLIDRQTNRYYAQIKFANIAERAIRTIAISVTARTIASEIELDHLYSGIVFASGTSYGSQVAVPLGEAQVLDIKVAVILVEFEDGDSWKGTKDTKWCPLPPRRPLEELGAPEQSLEMYRSLFKLAKYIPQASDAYWQCTCGKFNPPGYTVCMGCGFQTCDVMAAANLTALAEAELKWKKTLIQQVAYGVSVVSEKLV